MPVRRKAATAVLALLLAGAAACGGNATAGPGPATGTSAPSSALATPTDRSPHGVLLSAQLAMRDARRARFKLPQEGADGMIFWAPKTGLRFDRQGTSEQLIVLDTAAYLGGDPDSAARQGGRHWQKFSGRPGGKDVPYSALVDQLNPMVALTAACAAEAPELVGQEQLQETSVVHYRLTLGVDAYVAAQTQLGPERREALRQSLGADPGRVLTLDLWLNDSDQLVQLSRTGQAGARAATVVYGEIAGPLSLQAPAEADTLDRGEASPPPVPGG
ncbi:hypothetical protein AB0D08_14145 [Kitasatospora sp. NPDC048540]|uniref:hypothetical protein n=1 Tax=unclassified Kitasatospora TaxID=2633591 RepID=UPI0005398D0A|nr:hypothetical protein [Kitasatospora sp. MBT63]